MVSLVKSVGDLPNVVYLLSYHDVKLEELIGTAINIDGHEFLEKIIQYAIILPPVDQDDLWRLFSADLQTIFGNLSPEDQHRLGYEWHFTLRFYLEKPRDIRRFINALAVAHSNLGDYTDAMDLILLIVLQIFEPDVYWLVRRNLSDLTG